MFSYKSTKGFTVLELLIVIGIITLLISLVLVGLTRARSNSHDQELVAKLQNVVIGIEQFHDICKQYPETLTGNEDCQALSQQNKKIKDILAELDVLKFNQPGLKFLYTGLAAQPGSNLCTGFHVGVRLDNPVSGIAAHKSNFNSTQNGVTCGTATGFDGTDSNVFDVQK